MECKNFFFFFDEGKRSVGVIRSALCGQRSFWVNRESNCENHMNMLPQEKKSIVTQISFLVLMIIITFALMMMCSCVSMCVMPTLQYLKRRSLDRSHT